MPAVSAFQTRPFSAQSEWDEAPSFEGDGSSLFGTYLQRRAAGAGAQVDRPSMLPNRNPSAGSGLGKTGLPDQLKTGIESLSGYAMDEVKVHYNSLKPAEYQALAYTQGTDIHVAPGQERHLPHEAWHVVQQMAGRVRPTMQMKGVGVNDDAGLEREATVMGRKALQVRRSTGRSPLSQVGNFHRTNIELKHIQLASRETPIQCILTRAESVAGDLMHEKKAEIFKPKTLDEYKIIIQDEEIKKADKRNKLVEEIKKNRVVDYNVLSDEKLKNIKNIDTMVNNKESEHMYVHYEDKIHIADRERKKKLPHPALIGGDPDVTCAGTLNVTRKQKKKKVTSQDDYKKTEHYKEYSIEVTNESGHFRPDKVEPQTLDKIKKQVDPPQRKKGNLDEIIVKEKAT